MCQHCSMTVRIASATALILLACSSPEPTAVDAGEPVEVTASPVENLTTEHDEVAPPQVEEPMAGVLPSGFPSDVPVYTPSSLIEFGEGGGRFVLLATPDAVDKVRESYRMTLESAGWRRTGGGREERFAKEERTLRVEVRSRATGSEIRIAY